MKYYVDEKFVYFVQQSQDPRLEAKYLLHKTLLDEYGFFNTANSIPIYDLFVESKNSAGYNTLKRLEDLLMPKQGLAQGEIQLSLFWSMLGSWLRDHTTCFFHHERLHWERLRQPQGVPERTSGGVRCGYGQHPDHGSSCVRRLRWSCDCTGRRDGRLLNWHTGHSGISKGALYLTSQSTTSPCDKLRFIPRTASIAPRRQSSGVRWSIFIRRNILHILSNKSPNVLIWVRLTPVVITMESIMWMVRRFCGRKVILRFVKVPVWHSDHWHTGHPESLKGALQFICSPHTPQHHGNPFTHRNRNAQQHCG